MSEASVGSSGSGFRTIGVGVFGEGVSGTADDRLFRVEPGHDAGFVLEQAALLMGCVGKLTQHVMFEQDEAMLCAAHYLSGMAKALVEDLAHGMV
ncbi:MULTISPECIES: DUF3077 domain-containing protein [Pseudomonas]|uniref:DUF3077 domain-containing protein n=1 Tax=Pseudomonas TaxID=286 RepID=UPI0010A66F9E|nr:MULTISPECIES: DUF3077 domain-containing protein [Pseudomonas]MBM3107913.1 DUF3077 domain-containing protein [Pseudomonas arcuscaelestis]MBM3111406.1 DUF3077 domain-containing protein [Pseudomonas arcuscaelestis]